jgi:hypothetical protein
MPPPRTFPVEAHVGRMIVGQPFGRLDIGDDELIVRCRLIPCFRPQSVARSTITEVRVYRRLFRDRIRVADIAGAFSHVSIALTWRPKSLIKELVARGYPVTDRR